MPEATQDDPAPARPARSFAVVALIVLGLAAAGAGAFYEMNRAAPAPNPAPAPAKVTQAIPPPSPPPAETPKTGTAGLRPPAVDVVRVDQFGSLVMAGRAEPGETLTIHNGVTILGTTTADQAGQWVFLPDGTLPPGAHQFSIADKNAAATDSAARTVVLLGLPDENGGGAASGGAAGGGAAGGKPDVGPMVVLTRGNGPPRLLLAPSGSHPGPVGLDIVEYDDQGRIRFMGHAQPGRTVRLYVNDAAVGDAAADGNGLWTLTPAKDLPPGLYQLRTDELGAGGGVMARSEAPFARARLGEALAPGQAIVEPGDNLWTIARHSYGRGIVYTAIFEENRDQIRDPRRIYPGQAFHMPTPAEAAAAPEPAALSAQIRAEAPPPRHPPVKRREGGETDGG